MTGTDLLDPTRAADSEKREWIRFQQYLSEAVTHYTVSIVSQRPDRVPTLLQHGNFVVVDFDELLESANELLEDASELLEDDNGPLEEFFLNYQGAVSYLRKNGRPVTAQQLMEILEDQEPEDTPIRVASLREMAWLLVDNQDLADPFIGADHRGLMHAQWRIVGNGVIVWGFLERGENLLVIRADEIPGRPALRENTRGAKNEILDQYGHLVPRRSQ